MSKNVQKTNLSSKQRRAILLILDNKSVKEVAQSLGYSTKTIYRWLSNEKFSLELSNSENRVIQGISLRLLTLASRAVDSLEDVMTNPQQTGASNKRLAAVSIIQSFIKIRELKTIEEKIKKMEDFINEKFKKQNKSY